MELPLSVPGQELGTDKWPEGQVEGGMLFFQWYSFGGIPFLYIPWPKYTKSKSASSRAILSALVHPDVMNLFIKQHSTNEELWGKLF